MEAPQRDLQRNALIRANCELTAVLNDLPGFSVLRPSDNIWSLTWSDERGQNVELLIKQCFCLQMCRGRPIPSAPSSQLDSVLSILCCAASYWWPDGAGQVIHSPCRPSPHFHHCLLFISALINLLLMWSSHSLSQAVCVVCILLPVLSSSSPFWFQERIKYPKAIFFGQKLCILSTYEKKNTPNCVIYWLRSLGYLCGLHYKCIKK